MLRFAVAAIILAGVIVTAHPASTDALAATAGGLAQATAARQPANSAPALSRSSNTSEESLGKTERSNEFVPVGAGWG